MNDWRMKIAVLATVLGLGALGGYAMSSNRRADSVTTTSAVPATKVIRRTVHAKPPKHPRHSRAAAAPPVALTSSPVSSGTSGSSSSSAPVSTGTSGSGGGGGPVSTGTSGSGGGGGEGGGEHEGGDGGGD